MELRVICKRLMTDSLDGKITEGEYGADVVGITVPRFYGDHDLADFSFRMTEISDKEESIAEQVLTMDGSDDKSIHLLWNVTADFTAIGGEVTLVLAGVNDANTVQIKFVSCPLEINSDSRAEFFEPPTVFEQSLNQIQLEVQKAVDAAERAENAAGGTFSVPVATEETAGIIKSGGDIFVAEDGSVTVNYIHTHMTEDIDGLAESLEGKAAAEHTHVIDEVDGLSEVLDGKASVTHIHSYAGSSEEGGAADSALRLESARKISISGAMVGNAQFDGTGDITITVRTAEEEARANACGLLADFKNRSFERIGLSSEWNQGTDFDGTFYGNIRRCNVLDDGTVSAYYGDENFAEDGSNGQVMVEIPKFYYRVIPVSVEKISDGNGYTMECAEFYVSGTEGDGFRLHPAFDDGGTVREHIYVSAYEGSIYDASTGAYLVEDEQIMDTSADKLSSIANVIPCTGTDQNLTRSNLEKMAKNRGNGWHIMGIKELAAVQLLMIVEAGCCNMQNVFGNGVVSISDDGSANCASYTGSTSSLGNASGEAESTLNRSGDVVTEYTESGKVAVSWRGIENLWGNVCVYIGGITGCGDGTMKAGKPCVCTDRNYTEFSALGDMPENYISAEFELPNTANGHISAFGYDEKLDWAFIPARLDGNSALPVGDMAYMIIDHSGASTVYNGGHWFNSTSAGLFNWVQNHGPLFRYRHIGGRLSYIPEE